MFKLIMMASSFVYILNWTQPASIQFFHPVLNRRAVVPMPTRVFHSMVYTLFVDLPIQNRIPTYPGFQLYRRVNRLSIGTETHTANKFEVFGL